MQSHCRLHLITNAPAMSTSMHLQIPTPCSENWSAMDLVEKGRHCAACQKTVVDFTGMSDAEVVRAISQAGSNVCGRLAPDQLNRKLSDIPPVQHQWRIGLALVAGGAVIDGQGPGFPSNRGGHNTTFKNFAFEQQKSRGYGWNGYDRPESGGNSQMIRSPYNVKSTLLTVPSKGTRLMSGVPT